MLVRSEVPLSFPVDAEQRFARFPNDFTIKGMFLSRLAALASRAALDSVRDRLLKPESLKRYMTFGDYPQVDYSRLAHVVATDLYRSVGVVEGMRRVARQDLRTFAQSQVGRIMLALTGDATTAMMKLPEMYRAAIRGGSVEAQRIDAERVTIQFRNFYGWVDCYPIGTVEGLALHFSKTCEIDVTMQSDVTATYVVRLR